jgi:hypothetical protein
MQRLADPTGETVGRHLQWRNQATQERKLKAPYSKSEAF